jgi:hypothetical protein
MIFSEAAFPIGVSMHPIAKEGPLMSWFLLITLFSTTAVWILIRASSSSTRVVPVKEAATKLQEAWADHHTTA